MWLVTIPPLLELLMPTLAVAFTLLAFSTMLVYVIDDILLTL